MTPYVRQAVVVVHGMGEQLPLTTLTGFIDTALVPDRDGGRTYYSRPESVTGSYESRRFLAPPLVEDGQERRAHTEFFEYHWSHLMQGNRLDDLWPTFRRMLLQWPTRVPRGLKVVWLLAWGLILFAAWAAVWGPWRGRILGQEDVLAAVVGALVSGGVAAAVLSYVFSRVLPSWLTSSFVDVVRYLDTSPRSYAVRREIRKGLVEMLQALQDYGREPGSAHAGRSYDRIIIVAHSLGGFIAYDAVSYLWGRHNGKVAGNGTPGPLAGLEELERAASDLPEAGPASADAVTLYQGAQRALWRGLRAQGNPWIITDLVTVGTPMYFADQLLHGKGARSFARRIERRELPTCPPQNEEEPGNNIHHTRRFYSWGKVVKEKAPDGSWVRIPRRVLYEGAPFSVVRWTNLWFPARGSFFGDWFGGPLAPLFGPGIRDVPLTGNTLGSPGTALWRHRGVPAAAHSYYFSFPDDDSPGSAAHEIREGLDLASTAWVAGGAGGVPSPVAGP